VELGEPKNVHHGQSLPSDRQRAYGQIGMRRLDWVRITLRDGDEPTCEAVGVPHRVPSSRQIPLHLAVALATEGVPTVVRQAAASAL